MLRIIMQQSIAIWIVSIETLHYMEKIIFKLPHVIKLLLMHIIFKKILEWHLITKKRVII
jgi:hypothetical protein